MLLAEGARVALVGLQHGRLQALADLAPDHTAIHTSDVADSAAMQAVAADWMARHGAPGLVIANAGVASGFDTAAATDLAVLRRMPEINLLGAATTFQPFLAAAGARTLHSRSRWWARPASPAGPAWRWWRVFGSSGTSLPA
jgi:NADP-dependent 3-hydroxy acid dehydrogenase YdfG